MSKSPYKTMTVSGRTYALMPMPPIKALTFGPKVLSAVGTALSDAQLIDKLDADLIEQLRDKNASIQDKLKVIGPHIAKLLSALPAATLTDLMELVFTTEIKAEGGKNLSDPNMFNDHFRQYPGDMYQVAIWAIWENSQSFLFENLANFHPGGQQAENS